MVIDGQERLLAELDIELVNPAIDGTLRFAITSEAERAELELELFEERGDPNYRFVVPDDLPVHVRYGGGEDGIRSFLYENPPIIWFVDGSSLEGNQYVELRVAHPPYDAAKIEAWDWTGVDIRKESQGKGKDDSSIQARVIRELKTRSYAVIMDDDGKGEVADVVAIRLAGDPTAVSGIDIEFYHCKYSLEAAPGQRIKDLYEVCGQAQKSTCWMSSPEKRTDLFTHLLRREGLRQNAGGTSRFEVGDGELLQTIREMSRLCPVRMRIFIVQPGVSKANATSQQLQLMGVTENYLFETYQLPFGVIAST